MKPQRRVAGKFLDPDRTSNAMIPGFLMIAKFAPEPRIEHMRIEYGRTSPSGR